MLTIDYDVCVIGGGMVGAATALGLGLSGKKVLLCERHLPQRFAATQPPDLRVSAINIASQSLLEELGAWQALTQMRTQKFTEMEVWESDVAKTHFKAQQNDEYLGHIVENRLIQLSLFAQIEQSDNVDVLEHNEFLGFSHHSDHVTVNFSDRTVTAWLLVGADGLSSKVRELALIKHSGWQYSQQALGINIVKKQSSDSSITWQKFRTDGPLAYLPLFDQHASLVWYDNATNIAKLKGLSNSALKQEIQRHFPARLGDFDILKKASFPLTRMHANQYVKGRVVLVGDAAHSINPLAGQGVNLGFKDVSTLLRKLSGVELSGDAVSSVLLDYEAARKPHNLLMMSAMDAIYAMFSHKFSITKLVRNLGLLVAQHAGPVKQEVMRYAMGLDRPPK